MEVTVGVTGEAVVSVVVGVAAVVVVTMFGCLEDLTTETGTLVPLGIGIRVTRDAVRTAGGALALDILTGDMWTAVGEETTPFLVKNRFWGISPKEEVGEGSNGRFDCETVMVGPEVTEGRLELVTFGKAVALGHEAVELADDAVLLCTVLIEIKC